MSAELEAGLSAVRNMSDDPAPANDVAVTEQARVEATHTPGPWEVIEENGELMISAYQDIVVDPMMGLHACSTLGSARANAALIARAPEMAAQIAALQAECAGLKNRLELIDEALQGNLIARAKVIARQALAAQLVAQQCSECGEINCTN